MTYIAGGVTIDEKSAFFEDRQRQSFLKAEIISPGPVPDEKKPLANKIFLKRSVWSKDVQMIKKWAPR
ncbi:MAG: hypothetical protein NT047_07270 [Deltaproteobacteria bacterium]|nr:hypothetical protein [Deltaproteobacteria bacterium]